MNEMTSAIKKVEPSAIRSAWNRVFETNDPFAWPFRPEFNSGRIFYPTDGYHLTRVQYSAMTGALRSVSDEGFYISIVESEGLSFLEREWGHWSCEQPTYLEYCDLHLTLENALYGKDGGWGILISHEMHAVVSGSQPLMAALDERYIYWAEDLERLRADWSGHPDPEWAVELIARVGPPGSRDQ